MPKITVVTPTYHRHDKVQAIIRQLQAQTEKDFESLIIADSHDPAVEQIVGATKDTRFRYISTPRSNDWGHHQRAEGLRQAQGKYWCSVNDDNVIYPDYLKKLGDICEDVAICKIQHDVVGIIPKMVIPQWLGRGNIDMLNYMVSTPLAKRIGWTDYSYNADWEFLEDILISNPPPKIVVVNEVLGEHY